jgi:hypothetical protein
MQHVTTCITDPSLADALWAGAEVTSGRSGAPVRYRAAPSVADPSFLLPRSRHSAAAVLREFRNGGNAAARRRLTVLRAALVTTGGWPLLHALDVSPGRERTIETWVSDALSEPTTMGIHLGPPRANRKAILQVLDQHDRPRAVGKVSTSPLSRRLVVAEAMALSTLAGMKLPGLRIPQLLLQGDHRGSTALLMSHLPLREATPLVGDERRTAAMVTLARASGTRWALPADTGFVGRLHATALGIAEPEIREGCLRFLEALAELDEPWELGCWHGDWTNWNTAALDDAVLVWDWERFDTDVPVGWDALHHALRCDIETHGPVPHVARSLVDRSPVLLQPFGVRPSIAPYVAAAYLIEIACRYTGDGQRAAGGRSARVEEWVLPVLDTFLVDAHR